jgi:hypothetical protein
VIEQPSIERARVAQVTPGRGVYVTLDRFHRDAPSGPLVCPAGTPTLVQGDHILVGCIAGSLDDVVFVALLT